MVQESRIAVRSVVRDLRWRIRRPNPGTGIRIALSLSLLVLLTGFVALRLGMTVGLLERIEPDEPQRSHVTLSLRR